MSSSEKNLLPIQIAKKNYKHGIFGIRGFQKAQLVSNEREFCGEGLESLKYRRSRWDLQVVLVYLPTSSATTPFSLA